MPSKDDWKKRDGKSSARPEKADWRRAGGKSGAAAGGSPEREREWTQHHGYEAEKLLWVFRAKVAAGALLAMVLFGVLIWYLIPPTRTPFVSTVLNEYQYPILPNAWAGEDVAAIRNQLAKEGAGATGDEPLSTNNRPPIDYGSTSKEGWFIEIKKQLEEATDNSWTAKLKRLDRGPGDGAVILYISGHGVVDETGKPCLLLPRRSADVELMKRENWLSLEEFFDRLFYDREKKEQRLPASVAKLVVFDANRIDTAWHAGMIHNDFAGKLKTMVQKLPVDNLFVLNSTGRGEVGWAAPELGGSVFSFFFRRGLQGLADQEGFGDENALVSIHELNNYVRTKVRQWVENYRSDRQRPMLIFSEKTEPSDADRDLAHYGSEMLKLYDPTEKEATAARDKQVETMRSRWASIRDRYWDQYDQLAANAIRFHPLRWQEFQSKLLRLEQLVAAGPRALSEEKFGQRQSELDELKALLQQRPARGDTPNSIALIQAAEDGKVSDTVKKLSENLAAGKVIGPNEDYATRARAAWLWLKKNPTPENIEAAVEKAIPLAEITRRPDKEVVEIHFLRLLHRGLDARLWKSDSRIIRDVVTLRGQAEQAASPSDERLHYWLRPGVQEGDRIRRKAQDNLMVGRRHSELTDAKIDVTNAAKYYTSAQKLSETLVAAYALQDRAWAEIPQMITYHARRLPKDDSPLESDDKIETLIALRREIETQLVDFEKLSRADGSFPTDEIDHLRGRTQTLAARLKAERTELERQMIEFVAGDSNDDRRKIEETLAVPILTGEMRDRLYTTYLDLLENYTFVDATTSSDDAPDDSDTEDEPRRLQRIVSWREHPAIAMLDLPAAGLPPETEARVMKANTLLRRHLSSLIDKVHSVDQDRQRLIDLEIDSTSGPPHARRAIETAARSLRKASGLFRHAPLPGITPSEGLAMYDRQRMLLWHCQRTTDDWLGPAVVDDLHKPFFLTAANHYLAMAKIAAGGKHAARLEKRIKRREQASHYKGSDRSITALFAEQDRELLVRPDEVTKPHQVAISLTKTSGEHLPPGKAAYYLATGAKGPQVGILESDRGSQADIGRIDYTIDPRLNNLGRNSTRKYTILDIQQQMRSQRLQGFLAYRGHQFTGPAMVLQLTPYGCRRDMRYTVPKYPSPTVQIKGPRKRLAVMIVLDCSGSMTPSVGLDRLGLAKKVLAEILEDIQGVRDVEVGLRLYGHRAQYRKKTIGATSEHPYDVFASPHAKRLGGEHLSIRPPADVQKVIGLSKPAVVRALFRNRLRGVQAFGSTPLYLAMVRTLSEDFNEVDAENVRRQMIVITDGVNYQYKKDTYRDEGGKFPARATVKSDQSRGVIATYEDVADAIRLDRAKNENPIHISVVGIDISDTEKGSAIDDPTWNIGNKSQLERLLDPKKGDEFIEVSGRDVRQLKSKLRNAMGLYQYEIVDEKSDQRVALRVDGRQTDGRAELGEIVSIEGGVSGNLVIRFPEAPIKPYPFSVFGGERLTLRINDTKLEPTSKRFLEHFGDRESERPFRHGERKAPEILGPHGPLRIRPHKPKWKGNGLQFDASIQYEDRFNRIFTPCPREVFAIVRPFVDDRRSRFESEYAMFDVSFLKDRSIPTMSFFAPNWPEDVDEAQISIWLKFGIPTPPDETIQVGQTGLVKRMQVDGAKVEFTAKGERKDDGTFVVFVKESHPNADPNDIPYDTIRVQMQPGRQPDRIGRCYFPEAKTVEHRFIYDSDPTLTLKKLDGYDVHLTKVEKIKEMADVRFPDKKPILVRIGPKP